MHYSTVGFIATPQHGQLTIPKALRLYTSNSCRSCDPLGFTLEGRTDATASWDPIASGEWPGIAEGLGRNDMGLPINSTYENGDPDFTFTAVHFHGHSAPYLEYKLTFQLRSETTNSFQFAELEMPGMLLPPEPSASPTLSPSISPTKAPTDSPTVSPTKSPSESPSENPTANPTADLPDDGTLVNTLFSGSSVTDFGCAGDPKGWKARDGTTIKFGCDRTDMHDPSLSVDITGLIFTPKHLSSSIPKALRLYPSNSCQNCDPLNYILEGRVDAGTGPWVVISEGDFPLIAEGLGRNPEGLPISSSYGSGDPNLHYTQVEFHSNSAAFFEYKLSFPETKSPTSNSLRFAEVELAGMLLTAPPSASPTLDPSTSPTKTPTSSPSASPSENPTADLPEDGMLVNTIFDVGSPVTNFGCNNDDKNARAIDGSTGKFLCDRTGLTDQPTGIIVSPSHSQQSIAKALRFYTSNTCAKCDPVSYILEGRVDSTSAWEVIDQGDLDWIDAQLGRNDQWLPIVSTYESADDSHHSTEVRLYSNSAAYLEYKFTLVPRNAGHNTLQFAEVELPGMLLPSV